ncbi:MAG: hypothetical protein C4523_17845 [Myxococcales bacterium]|nr:MAG: hypothetical protein C4523_17845 [Myxococcales bacterium]
MDPNAPPSPILLAILAAIDRFQKANGASPSYAELAGEFGWKSDNSVRRHLAAMTRAGLIESPRGKRRSLRITSGGRIALGQLSSATDGAVPVTENRLRHMTENDAPCAAETASEQRRLCHATLARLFTPVVESLSEPACVVLGRAIMASNALFASRMSGDAALFTGRDILDFIQTEDRAKAAEWLRHIRSAETISISLALASFPSKVYLEAKPLADFPEAWTLVFRSGGFAN